MEKAKKSSNLLSFSNTRKPTINIGTNNAVLAIHHAPLPIPTRLANSTPKAAGLNICADLHVIINLLAIAAKAAKATPAHPLVLVGTANTKNNIRPVIIDDSWLTVTLYNLLSNKLLAKHKLNNKVKLSARLPKSE